jgi:F-type H+-transporting ATPase subunit c
MKKLWTMLISFSGVFLTSSLALAADGGAAAGNWGMPMAIGLGIGVAALGGALGQSRAVATALEGICRNPNASDKVFVPMILGLAFIESLVLFTWVLMFLLLGKI